MARSRLRDYQRLLAPGTPLREGLDRILHGRTGAMVVLGNNARVRQVCTGGFQLDVDFTPQALRELAKMDGAIVLSQDLSRIVAAAVHLVPPGDLPTAETGTRHRSADRTAQHAGVPVVTVSASMSLISLFLDGHRTLIETTDQMMSHANQTLATLARFVTRLGAVLDHFNALEVASQVTLRDLVGVAHQYEMTRRLSDEMTFHLGTLGVEGRLISMQHAELISGLMDVEPYLRADYAHNVDEPDRFTLEHLRNFTPDELLSPSLVADHLGFPSGTYLETPVTSRGTRLLTQVGRLPSSLVERLSASFTLQELFGTSVADLLTLDGVGPARARMVRDAMVRITEASERVRGDVTQGLP